MSIFFSDNRCFCGIIYSSVLDFDVKDHYKDFGGDAAAYVAPVSLSEAEKKNCCLYTKVRLLKYSNVRSCLITAFTFSLSIAIRETTYA